MEITNARCCSLIPECQKSRENEFQVNASDRVKPIVPESDSLNCCCCCDVDDTDDVPKVFPKHPIASESPSSSSNSNNHDGACPPTCPTFFQKVMENAKSILNIKCSSIHPPDQINEEPTKDVDPSTTENDVKHLSASTGTSRVDYASFPTRSSSDDCLCDQSSKIDTSTPSYSCSCSYKISNDQNKDTSTCSCKTQTTESNLSQRYKSETPKSEYDSYEIDSKTKTISGVNTTVEPKNVIAWATTDKGISSTVETCYASCSPNVRTHSTGTKIYQSADINTTETNNDAQSNKTVTDEKFDAAKKNYITSTVQNVKQPITKLRNFDVNSDHPVKVGRKTSFCGYQECPAYLNVTKTPTAPNISYGQSGVKENSNFGTSLPSRGLPKRGVRDQTDQCAFIGSPILKTANFGTGLGESKSICCCLPKRNKSSQMFNMITEIATQEKEMKDQIQSLIEREKSHDDALKSFQKLIRNPPCCCSSNRDSNPTIDIEKLSQELRLENSVLKTELMELKLELKHCLEKVEGPMKRRLETEQLKCVQLQKDLREAGENIMVNHDSYMKEMNSLKMQLCMACSNMTELSTINKNLKKELGELDCLCGKLEDDLVKQKLSEAETLRRLKKRLSGNKVDLQPSPVNIEVIQPPTSTKPETEETVPTEEPPVLDEPVAPTNEKPPSKETTCSESNLNTIARQLSTTLKESAPCEECSKLPVELTQAAKCIKNLTDMVESRQVKKFKTNLIKDCYSQSPPPTQESFCQCCDCKDVAIGESLDQRKAPEGIQTKTIYSVPPDVFVDHTISSHENVNSTPLNVQGLTPPFLQKTSRETTVQPATEMCSANRVLQPLVPPQVLSQESPSAYFSAPLIKEKSPVGTGSGPCDPACKYRVYEVPDETGKSGEKKFKDKITDCSIIGTSHVPDTVGDSSTVTAVNEKNPPLEMSTNQTYNKEILKEAQSTHQSDDDSVLPKEDARNEDNSVSRDTNRKKCFDSCQADCVVADTPCADLKIIHGDTISKSENGTKVLESKPEAIEKESLEQYQEPKITLPEKESPTPDDEGKSNVTSPDIPEPQKSMPSDNKTAVSFDGKPERAVKEPESIEEQPDLKVNIKLEPPEQFGESNMDTKEFKPIIKPALNEEEVLLSHQYLCPPSCYKDGTPCEPTVPTTTAGATARRSSALEAANYVSNFLIETLEEEGDLRLKRTAKRSSANEAANYVSKILMETVEEEDIRQRSTSKGSSDVKEELPPEIEEEGPIKLEKDETFDTTSPTTEQLVEEQDKTDELLEDMPTTQTLSKSPISSQHPSLKGKDQNISKSQEGKSPGAPQEIPIHEEKSENFPFDVDVTGVILSEPPPGLIVTTTITNSGNLEVITEGPAGIIETELNYREDGVIEVVTQITERIDEDISMPTDTEISANFTYKMPSQGFESQPKRFSDASKVEFEKQKEELRKQVLVKDSILSGASGLTDRETETPSSQNDIGKPSQLTEKSNSATETSLGTNPTQNLPKDEFDSSGQTYETPGKIDTSLKASTVSNADASKAEFGKGKKELKKQGVVKDAMPSDAFGLSGEQTNTPSSKIDSSKPSQLTDKSVRDTETSLATKPTDNLPNDTLDVLDPSSETPNAVDTSLKASTVGSTDASKAEFDNIKGEFRNQTLVNGSKPSGTSGFTSGETPSNKIDTSKPSQFTEKTVSGTKTSLATKSTDNSPQDAFNVMEQNSEKPEKVDASLKTSTIGSKDAATSKDKVQTGIQHKQSVSSKNATTDAALTGTNVQQTSFISTATKEAMPDPGKTSVQQTTAIPAVSAGVSPDIIANLQQTSQHSVPFTPSKYSDAVEDVEQIEHEEVLNTSLGKDPLTNIIKFKKEPPWEESTEKILPTNAVKTEAISVSAKQPVEIQKVDCGCQSSVPVEQSCQCCDCKDIGVSTSKDTETITDSTMTRENLPKLIQKDSPSASFHTVGDSTVESKVTEESEGAIATPAGGKTLGTTDEISTINEESEQTDPSKSADVKEESETFESTTEFSHPIKAEHTLPAFTQQTERNTEDKHVGGENIPEETTESRKQSPYTKDPSKKVEVKEESDNFESATEFSQPTKGEETLSESFAQQTEKNTEEKHIGSGKIREVMQDLMNESPDSKDVPQSDKKPKRKRSNEVPDSVSKLSDKAMPPLTDSSETKKPRRKRSSKLGDIHCECSGLCQCLVCSPEIIAKRKALTGQTSPPPGSPYKLCCCTSPAKQQKQTEGRRLPTENVYLQTQIQPITKTDHPSDCICYLCRCDQCLECPQENTEAFLKSTNLENQATPARGRQRPNIDDIFDSDVNVETSKGCRANIYEQIISQHFQGSCPNPTQCPESCAEHPVLQRISHPSNCECVDCLCFPKIQELAQTIEFPVVKDEKQIYQVHSMKCSCPNAQNVKRLLERSRIPIATNSRASPPATKHSMTCDCEICRCSPCADASKRSVKPEVSEPETSDTGDLSKTDDDTSKISSNLRKCCCKPSCVCEVCLVSDLQRKLDEVTRQLNEQVIKMSAKPSKITPKTSKISPKASNIPRKQSKLSHPTDCDCYECKCAGKPALQESASKVSEKPKETGQPKPKMSPPPQTGSPLDCDCYECKCNKRAVPSGEASDISKNLPETVQPEPKMSPPPQTESPLDCDCYECKCNKRAVPETPAKETAVPPSGTAAPPAEPTACDCLQCVCGPCADPSKNKGDTTGVQALIPCDCQQCECSPCADPSRSKQKQPIQGKSSKMAKPHSDSCTCVTCPCEDDGEPQGNLGPQGQPNISKTAGEPGKEDLTGTTFGDCTCGECICPGKDKKNAPQETKVDRGPSCDCEVCECPGSEQLGKADKPSMPQSTSRPGRTETGVGPTVNKTTHPEDCSCSECTCDDAIKTPESAQTQDTHPQDCTCYECKCLSEVQKPPVSTTIDRETHAADCLCDACLCDDQKHEKGCCCLECKCIECYMKKDTATHSISCTCGECTCEDCDRNKPTTPESKGDGGQIPESKSFKREPVGDDVTVRTECQCDQCKCTDCYFSKPSTKTPDCQCQPCLCPSCEFKKTTANVPSTQAVKFTEQESKPAAELPINSTQSCHCINCACDICNGRSRGVGDKEVIAKVSVRDQACHSPKCDCETCVDKKEVEIKHSAAKKGDNCACLSCVCIDCQISSVTKSPDATKADCQCVPCNCEECLNRKPLGTTASAKQSEIKSKVSQTQPPVEVNVTSFANVSNTPAAQTASVKQSEIKSKISQMQPPVEVNVTSFAKVSNTPTPQTNDSDPPPFEVPVRKQCDCKPCNCIICIENHQISAKTEQKFSTQQVGTEAPQFEVPVSIGCNCFVCQCIICNKQALQMTKTSPQSESMLPPAQQPVVSIHEKPMSAPTGTRPSKGPVHCNCPTCVCPSEMANIIQGKTSSKMGDTSKDADEIQEEMENTRSVSVKTSKISGKPSKVSGKNLCICSSCNCTEEITKLIYGRQFDSGTLPLGKPSEKTVVISGKASRVSGKASRVSGKPADCPGGSCTNCVCENVSAPIEPSTNIADAKSTEIAMVCQASKAISIASKTVQPVNSAVKSEYTNSESPTSPFVNPVSVDISKLDDDTLMKKIESGKKENCECREQIKEIRRALNKIKCACTEAEMKAAKNKPFIKQASTFGQTMSGLKLALHNLQEKCKAKDKMIDAMTGELRQRTSSNTINKILNISSPNVLDYDKAKYVKSFDNSRNDAIPTDVIYPTNEERELKVNDFDTKMSKAISTERSKIKSRSSKICKCGKSHRDRDTQRVNLMGFEIIDIRRITQDSIIIKWKAPKSNLITGYDIFVNGVHKSKVMSGGRTSAMIHSLDLSSTIQLTIYAVTKCGRCEPPAIAIYEIN